MTLLDFKKCYDIKSSRCCCESDGKSITLVATDKKNKSSNDYSISVGETSKTFTLILKQKTLKWFQMIMMLLFLNKR